MSWDDHDEAVRTQLRRVGVQSIDDSGSQQFGTLSGLKSETMQKVAALQHHGFTSNPPSGGEGVLLTSGGRSDRAWFLGSAHPDFRPTGVPSGASVLYDDKGNMIRAYGTDGVQIEAKQGNAWMKPAKGQIVYLGGKGPTDGGTYAPVMTSSGPSQCVYARLDPVTT